MNDDFMVFSGTANLPLAEKVANYLGLTTSGARSTRSTSSTFPTARRSAR